MTPPVHITLREMEVWCYLTQGLVNKEIATRMDISYRTVSQHRENLYRKLGVNHVAAAVLAAVKYGLVKP